MQRMLASLLITTALAGSLAGCKRAQGGSTTGPMTTETPAAQTLSQVPLGAPPGQPIDTSGIKNPFDADPAAIQEGKQLFGAMNCVYCHGAGGSGLIGPPLNGPGWRYGDSPAQIYNSIHDGRPQGMPAWGDKLPPDQIWKLVAYIQDLDHHPQPSTTGDQPADQAPADTAQAAEDASKAGGKR